MKLVTSQHDGAPSSNIRVAQEDRYVLSSLATEGNIWGMPDLSAGPSKNILEVSE